MNTQPRRGAIALILAVSLSSAMSGQFLLPTTVAAHSTGCQTHADHYVFHNGHSDRMILVAEGYFDDGSHWHKWKNMNHGTTHRDNCGGADECYPPPCPETMPGARALRMGRMSNIPRR